MRQRRGVFQVADASSYGRAWPPLPISIPFILKFVLFFPFSGGLHLCADPVQPLHQPQVACFSRFGDAL